MYHERHCMTVKEFDRLVKKTPRKVAAAVRYWQKQDKAAEGSLFDFDKPRMTQEQIEQRAHERVDYYLHMGRQRLVADRKRDAKNWIKLRRARRFAPDAVRVSFDRKWQAGIFPGRPEYGLDLLWCLLRVYYFDEPLWCCKGLEGFIDYFKG